MVREYEVVGQRAWEVCPVPCATCISLSICVHVFAQAQDDYSKQVSTNWAER